MLRVLVMAVLRLLPAEYRDLDAQRAAVTEQIEHLAAMSEAEHAALP